MSHPPPAWWKRNRDPLKITDPPKLTAKPPRVHAKGGSLHTPSGSSTFIYVGAHVEVATGSPGWLRLRLDALLKRYDTVYLPASFTQYDALSGLWVRWPRDGMRFEVKSNPPVKVVRVYPVRPRDLEHSP